MASEIHAMNFSKVMQKASKIRGTLNFFSGTIADFTPEEAKKKLLCRNGFFLHILKSNMLDEVKGVFFLKSSYTILNAIKLHV